MVGLGEALVIAGAIVLLFGASQIPKIARSLGEGLREFRKALREGKEGEPGSEGKDAPPETRRKD